MTTFRKLRALLLPITVAGLVPLWLLLANRGPRAWLLNWPWSGLTLALGLMLALGGLMLLIGTISAFARIGSGTLAPWDPPRKLVVEGIYRRVRNPMISGVFAILLGEVLLFGSSALLWWFLFVVFVNLIYIPLLEEKGLEKRFGEAYRIYKKHVPRWIPRLRPWDGMDPAV